jgi:hypothetical protein
MGNGSRCVWGRAGPGMSLTQPRGWPGRRRLHQHILVWESNNMKVKARNRKRERVEWVIRKSAEVELA